MSDLAIKYSMMKKKKRMAHGGSVDEGPSEKANQMGVHRIVPNFDRDRGEIKHGQSDARYGNAKAKHEYVLNELKSMPKPNLKGLAEGGEVDEHIREREEHQKGVHKTGNNTTSSQTKFYSKADPEYGKDLHRRRLEEMRSINPKLKGLADGGFVEEENMSGYVDHLEDEEMMNEAADQEDDLISRALKSRKNMYSEGGRVANEGEDELSHMADSDPNEFDDLALEDDLKSSYTGENSGDELGNEQEDHDREDIVSRVMASRRKKDRLPNPR